MQISGAIMNKEKTHRYSLWRIWDETLPMVLFIGLNPSKADAVKNDKTISRCAAFAKRWEYGGFYFANLYSFRTPYVYGPLTEEQIKEGWSPLFDNLDNAADYLTDTYLSDMIRHAATVVCAWGAWPFTTERAMRVLNLILAQKEVAWCLRLTKKGQPWHPLYLPNTSKLIVYRQAKREEPL